MSRVRGSEQVARAFTDLAYTGATRASSAGLRAGLTVISRAIRAAAPVGKTGLLKRNVGQRFKKGTKKGVMVAKAGLNVGKGKPTAKGSSERKTYAFHAHLVALGTVPRWAGVKYGRRKVKGKSVPDESRDRLTGKKVRYTGVMPANDFARKAAMASATAAAQAVQKKVGEEIIKEIQRSAPKGAAA